MTGSPSRLLVLAVAWELDGKRLKGGPQVFSAVAAGGGRAGSSLRMLRLPALIPVAGAGPRRTGPARREEELFMSRSAWKRALTLLLIVMVCTLAVPAKASATALTMDSAFHSALKLWTTAIDWLSGFWTAPAASSAPRGGFKFGAGHSSDGLRATKAGAKASS